MKKTLFSFVSMITVLSTGTALAGGTYGGGYDPYFEGGGYGAVAPQQYEAPRTHANKSAYEQMMLRMSGADEEQVTQRAPQQQQQQQQRPYDNGGYNQYGASYNQYGNAPAGVYEEERRYDGNKVAYEQMMQSTQSRTSYTNNAEQQYKSEQAETEEPKNIMQRGRSVFQGSGTSSQSDYGRYGR